MNGYEYNADGINDDGVSTRTYLGLQKGLHGYFVVLIRETNDLGIMDYDIERVKDSMERYQFATREEAIADFEKWAGDAYDRWEEVRGPDGYFELINRGPIERSWLSDTL